MAILIMIIPLVILALLGLAAHGLGVDSRDDFTTDRSPVRPTGIEVR